MRCRTVCVGYEKLSLKAKLAKLDELIVTFKQLGMEGLDALLTERAEVASRIGKKADGRSR